MAKRKTTLQRQLEERIRRAHKAEELDKPNALADRLRRMDDEDRPDSLANPDDYPDEDEDE